MQISVIGSGHGGCTLAADLIRKSHDVTLYSSPLHMNHYNMIKQYGGLQFDGKHEDFIPINKLTTSINEAVIGKDILLMVLPAQASESTFHEMLPHLHDGQIILSIPGSFTALTFQDILRKQGNNTKLILGDTDSLPYACRVIDGKIKLLEAKQEISLAFLNSDVSQEIVYAVQNVLPCRTRLLKNYLEVGLSNLNSVVHPLTCLLNIGWIENTHGNFYFYKEGISQTVAKLLDGIDQERIAIGQKLNLSLPKLVEMISMYYGTTYETIYDFARYTIPHNLMKASPNTLKTRYVIEDVPYSLVPWYYLAKYVDVNVPTITMAIQLASLCAGINYFDTGRVITANHLDSFEITLPKQ